MNATLLDYRYMDENNITLRFEFGSFLHHFAYSRLSISATSGQYAPYISFTMAEFQVWRSRSSFSPSRLLWLNESYLEKL